MSKNWYVLYVKPKNEKKVAERLSAYQVDVYCPMIKEVKQWSDRKKTIFNFKENSFLLLKQKTNSRIELITKFCFQQMLAKYYTVIYIPSKHTFRLL